MCGFPERRSQRNARIFCGARNPMKRLILPLRVSYYGGGMRVPHRRRALIAYFLSLPLSLGAAASLGPPPPF